MGDFPNTMIGFLTTESSARPDVEPFGECVSLEGLCLVPAGKIRRNQLRLRRSVLSRAGTLMRMDVVIQLIDGRSWEPRELEEVIRDCCSNHFEYAISTSHAKTILHKLESREGYPVGDLTATFRSA
jgi:hypothetical protein